MLQTNVVKTVRFKIQLALGCSILIQLGSLEIDILFLITTIISGQSYAEKNRSIQITKHRMSVENYTFIIINFFFFKMHSTFAMENKNA